MNFTPIRGGLDRVVVRPDQASKTTATGLTRVPGSVERPMQGTIVSISEDNRSAQGLTVKRDMKVLFGKFGVNEIEINGEKLLIMRETDIFGYLS